MARLTPYFLYRRAGLPMCGLASLRTAPEGTPDEAPVRDLQEARERMFDQLYGVVPLIESKRARRRVLRLRRSMASAQRLAEVDLSHVDEDLADAPLAQAVRDLQEAARDELSDATAQAREHELRTAESREALRRRVADPTFLAGVLRSSKPLLDGIPTYLDTPIEEFSRTESRTEDGILGYFSRATAKTSPFSTFTAVGWGEWSEVDERPSEIAPTRARLNRAIVERIATAARSLDASRRDLRLRANPTLTLVSEGARYLKGEGGGKTMVAVPVTRTLQLVLGAVREDSAATWSEVVERLSARTGTAPEAIDAFILRLVSDQVLAAILPFPDQDVLEDPPHRYEKQVASWIQSSATGSTRGAGAALLRAIEHAERYVTRDLAGRRDEEAGVEESIREAERAVGLEPHRGPSFFEDAVFESVARLPEASIAPCVNDLAALGAFTSAFHPSHRRRLHIAEAVIEAGLVGKEVPLIEAYRLTTERDRGGGLGASLAEEEMDRYLEALKIALVAAVARTSRGVEISVQRLAEASPHPPATITPPLSAGFFVQKGRAGSDPWVVNLVVDGLGKFFSRFTSQLGSAGGSAIGNLRCSAQDAAPPGAILADITATFANNVNIRVPVYDHVIELPGAGLPLNSAVPILPSDLLVTVDEDRRATLSWQRTGQAVVPMHGGFLVSPRLPPLARFLLNFASPRPMPIPFHEIVDLAGSGRNTDRLYFGSLLLYRRRWAVRAEDLPELPADESISETTRRLSAWATETGIPPDAFLRLDNLTQGEVAGEEFDDIIADNRSRTKFKRKPQYIDFSAPVFANRIRRALASVGYRATFEEAYPSLRAPMSDHSFVTELFVEVAGGGAAAS